MLMVCTAPGTGALSGCSNEARPLPFPTTDPSCHRPNSLSRLARLQLIRYNLVQFSFLSVVTERIHGLLHVLCAQLSCLSFFFHRNVFRFLLSLTALQKFLCWRNGGSEHRVCVSSPPFRCCTEDGRRSDTLQVFVPGGSQFAAGFVARTPTRHETQSLGSLWSPEKEQGADNEGVTGGRDP
ncbi:hypothetical protein NDU88_005123 [Pleurodeles waltl]|uniref:Uncharacterized protein n=1 Tax=Pleurodeles waltl TaxID=8319 RepID=A0AAV7PEG5_PLEWA|nr:hypothetical protein NDU88_005123 [Pleurodeles waltl]